MKTMIKVAALVILYNYDDAKNDGPGVIAKCIIPKGAEYYEGYFCGRKAYASNKLKYTEIVTK